MTTDVNDIRQRIADLRRQARRHQGNGRWVIADQLLAEAEELDRLRAGRSDPTDPIRGDQHA